MSSYTKYPFISERYENVWKAFAEADEYLKKAQKLVGYNWGNKADVFRYPADYRVSIDGVTRAMEKGIAGTDDWGEEGKSPSEVVRIYWREHFKEVMFHRIAYLMFRHYLDMEMDGKVDESYPQDFANVISSVFNQDQTLPDKCLNVEVYTVAEILKFLIENSESFTPQFIGELTKMLIGDFNFGGASEATLCDALFDPNEDDNFAHSPVCDYSESFKAWYCIPELPFPVVQDGEVITNKYTALLPFHMMFDSKTAYSNFINHIYSYGTEKSGYDEKALLKALHGAILDAGVSTDYKEEIGDYEDGELKVPYYKTEYCSINYKPIRDLLDKAGGFGAFCGRYAKHATGFRFATSINLDGNAINALGSKGASDTEGTLVYKGGKLHIMGKDGLSPVGSSRTAHITLMFNTKGSTDITETALTNINITTDDGMQGYGVAWDGKSWNDAYWNAMLAIRQLLVAEAHLGSVTIYASDEDGNDYPAYHTQSMFFDIRRGTLIIQWIGYTGEIHKLSYGIDTK